MKPDEVRERLASVRDAGRELGRRPLRDTIESLARVLDAWSDAGSRWRTDLVDALPAATGFTTPLVREGLRAGLGTWTGDALRELAARELALRNDGVGIDANESGVAAVFLAGSIPMPSLLALIGPLARGHPVLAKCAGRDPVTPRLVAQSIAALDETLGSCISTVSFDGSDGECVDAFLEAEHVVATGSDETVADVVARVGSKRVVASGHRLSLTVVGPDALATHAFDDLAARIAYDTAMWDQLGCLSPVSVHAVGAADGDVDRLAECIAAALADAESRWPRGEVSIAAQASIAHERSAAEVRRAAGKRVAIHAPPDGRFTVVREDEAAVRAAPLHRFLRIHPVPDLSSLAQALRPHARHLAAVALEGFGADGDTAAKAVLALGASRVCRPGELQSPPLGWRREERDVLQPHPKSNKIN